MSKKQFIRHLEYYGFPDQNNYTSAIENPDISDIIKKNREQDEEIEDLEDEKASKAEINELSNMVTETFSAQDEFNHAVVGKFHEIDENITELKEIDNEFAEQLSALTEGVNSLNENFEDFSGDTNESISALTDDVDELKDKSSTYALKENTYTKEEVDDLLSGTSGYATVEWVLEQEYVSEEELEEKLQPYATMEWTNNLVENKGFITVDSADTRYVAINDFTELKEQVDTNTVAIEEETSRAINIESSLSGNIEDEAARAISAETELSNSIENLYGVKADKTDIDSISGAVDTLRTNVNTKVDQRTFDETRRELTDSINALDTSKADKTELENVSVNVNALDNKINSEISRATGVESELNTRMSTVEGNVNSAITVVESFDERVDNVETGLANEISNREQADLNLIGNDRDYDTADTIWGAKAYAKEMRRQAISSANMYTDDAINGFSADIAQLEDEMNRKFTSAATTEYVNTSVDRAKNTLIGYTDTEVGNEKNRAERAEGNLLLEINNINDNITAIASSVSENSTKISAITSWNGQGDYDDSGTGVLDVLHREFHELIDVLKQKGILP